MTTDEEEFWETLFERIDDGQVIPIIGYWIRTKHIFDINRDRDLGLPGREGESHGTEPITVETLAEKWRKAFDYPFPSELLAQVASLEGITQQEEELVRRSCLTFLRELLLYLQKERRKQLRVEEELAEEWADKIGYPLLDKHRLARVAVFNRVRAGDDETAKKRYLRFLKEKLLELAKEDQSVSDQLDEIKREKMGTMTFSDYASGLGYPRFENERHDPLRRLAKLRLPIYVTTSPFDFMERALDAEGREQYSTHVCFFSHKPVQFRRQPPDPDFTPTPDKPVVVHLHGLELYPKSLVLSEDDYLEFADKAIAAQAESRHPFIPRYLRDALNQWSVILLGYRLYDWDFRVLFRGLIATRPIKSANKSLVIQLDPEDQGEQVDQEMARNYLEEFFDISNFKVEWVRSDSYVQDLCDRYDDWRR